MSQGLRRPIVVATGLLLAVLSLTGIAVAQESKSEALVKELAALLGEGKLDSIAAKDPSGPDQYVAALYFPAQLLLVISAKYQPSIYINEKLGQKDYKEIYQDLQSASVAGTKVFVQDLSADGLKARRESDRPFDTYQNGNTEISFDGDWKKQKLSEEDYMKSFADADEKYSAMLSALLSEVKKKPS